MKPSVQTGDSMADPGTHEPAGRSDPGDTQPPPAGQAARRQLGDSLRAMERQLRQHSALEDLGPLFGPEAQGRAGSPPQG